MTSIEKALNCGLKREDLATDLWRRSARLYKTAGALHKAAEAWLAAGDKSAAAELFFAAGDDPQAAELFFECGRLDEAVTSAGRYLKNSSTKDFSHKIAARLILAAAGSKSGDRALTSSILREVRAELVSLDNDASQFQLGQSWESLARFGCRAKRPDLVRLGFGKALLVYGLKFNLQRLRCAHDYLDAVAGDRVLEIEIESRIVGFKQDFSNINETR